MKVGLINVYVKTMGKYKVWFAHLRQKCPKISKTKKKEGISVGLQITQLFEDQDFNTNLNSTEKKSLEGI
jgi:hypothetical protein